MAKTSLSLDELVRKLMGDEHADVLRETLALKPGRFTHALDAATCEALERQLVDVSRLWGIDYRRWTLSQWRAYVAAGRPPLEEPASTTWESSCSVRWRGHGKSRVLLCIDGT